MTIIRAARILAFSVFCCLSMAAASQTAAGTSGVRTSGIGIGAFPLSFTDASAWFTNEENDKSKVLAALFYFQGTPGWLTGEETDFKWQLKQDPATIDMMVRNVPIHAKYWRSTDEVEIMGKRYRRSDANVFFIAHIDAPTPVVMGLGVHDLNFKSDEIPSIALLRRDPEVWAAVTGHFPGDHPLGKKPVATEEIRSWDEQGLELLQSDQPDEERKGCELLRQAAEKGYAPAQYRLGYCYESGKGIDQNFSIANQWYAKAAEQGYVDAQYKLGYSFTTGRGTRIDLAMALNWYKKAADSGDRDALHNVGWMYATGQGVKPNQQEAYRWFLDAAKHGDPGGQLEIVRRLNEGNGIHKDVISAYSWLLVLKAQKSKFLPEAWNEINSIMTSVEAQLDAAGKGHAGEQALKWMGIIATADMYAYSHQ